MNGGGLQHVELQRVVLVAENCSVRMGGEAILPYHYFRLLRARGLDAHLVVHARVRNELETLFPRDRDRLHFVPDHPLQKLFFHAGKLLPHRVQEATLGLLNQLMTQAAQRPVVRKLVMPGCVVHQPIPVSPRFPSLLYDVGAPVVIGPLNGGMTYPPGLRGPGSRWGELTLALGRSLANFGNRLFPGKLRAAVVLVANTRTRAALPAPLGGRIVELVENGVDLALWSPHPEPLSVSRPGVHPESKRTRPFLFLGRLVDWKALDLVLDALTTVPSAELDVIGDGPMLPVWRAQAERLGLSPRVRFLGWQSQAECARHLAGCTALVLPSLYECGGAVVLEAMAMSRPVVATAWGGPADYLDAGCGILIPPTDRASLVAGFAHAIQTLLASPARASSLGAAGRARLVQHFDWDRKMDRMLEVYRSTL